MGLRTTLGSPRSGRVSRLSGRLWPETEGTCDGLACRPRRDAKAGRAPGSRDATRQELLKPGSLAPCHTEPRPLAQLQFLSLPAFLSLSLALSTQLQDDQSRLRASQTSGLQAKHLATEPNQEAGPSGHPSKITALSELLPPTPEASTAVLLSRLFLDLERKMQQPGQLSRVWLVLMSTDVWATVSAFTCCTGHLGRGPDWPPGAFLYKPSRGCVLSCFLSQTAGHGPGAELCKETPLRSQSVPVTPAPNPASAGP